MPRINCVLRQPAFPPGPTHRHYDGERWSAAQSEPSPSAPISNPFSGHFAKRHEEVKRWSNSFVAWLAWPRRLTPFRCSICCLICSYWRHSWLKSDGRRSYWGLPMNCSLFDRGRCCYHTNYSKWTKAGLTLLKVQAIFKAFGHWFLVWFIKKKGFCLYLCQFVYL